MVASSVKLRPNITFLLFLPNERIFSLSGYIRVFNHMKYPKVSHSKTDIRLMARMFRQALPDAGIYKIFQLYQLFEWRLLCHLPTC